MKKGTLLKNAAAAAAALLMCACMKIDMDCELKKDGTADLTFTYAISSQYASDEDMADGEHEIQHFNYDGQDYVGYSESHTYSSYAELTADMTSLSEDGTTLFSTATAEQKKGLFTTTYVFDAVSTNLMGSEEMKTDDGTDYSAMAAQMLDVSFSIAMPGKITEAGGGTIEGNKVKYKMATNAETSYHVESSETNVSNICICAGLALAVIAAAIVVLTKKKGGNSPDPSAAYSAPSYDGFSQPAYPQTQAAPVQDTPVQDTPAQDAPASSDDEWSSPDPDNKPDDILL
ncbi:MAG: hypothetical protein II695_09155 [Oscillospiraceae bacterium]|nr:hypothetical protein [Oscillospiraceae bacterium]